MVCITRPVKQGWIGRIYQLAAKRVAPDDMPRAFRDEKRFLPGQIPGIQTEFPGGKMQVPGRLGMVEYQIPVHPFGHCHCPLLVARQKPQAGQCQAEQGQRYFKQQRLDAQSQENPRDHVPVAYGFSAGDIVCPVRYLHGRQGLKAGRCHIPRKYRLTQTDCRTQRIRLDHAKP